MSPLSPTAKLSELSATQVLKLIAEAPSLVRRNSPNARVTLNFDPLPNELCQSTAGAGLLFVATATVAKGGLGAELRLSLRVDASLNRLGKLSTIELSREHWLQPLTSAQLRALGLEVADADSYQDLYLQWTVTYTRETQGWAGLGALRVYGRNPDPGCLAARAELADTPAAPVSSLSCGRTKAVYDESEGIYLPPGTQLLEVNYESTP